MGLKFKNLQNWISQNRLLLWWFIFIPLLALIVIDNWKQLNISPGILENDHLSFIYKVFNSMALILIARICLIAVGLLIVMVCLFFPSIQLSREGVQWTKEIEELAEVSEKITGEAVSELVKEETARWTLIYGWLKIREQIEVEADFLLRELLATVWTAFPVSKLNLSFCDGDDCYAITHLLLPKLVPGEVSDINSRINAFGLEIHFSGQKILFLNVFPSIEAGFSKIDEGFMLILEEIFTQEILKRGFSAEQLLAYFDKEILTYDPIKV